MIINLCKLDLSSDIIQRIQVMARRHENEIFELANELGLDPGVIMVKISFQIN